METTNLINVNLLYNNLQDDISGNILLSLTYKPEQCTIDGVILRVANLHHSDLSGTRGKQDNLELGKSLFSWLSYNFIPT